MWARDEIHLLWHPEAHPLSLRGLWQRARPHLWLLAGWSLCTAALLISDALLYRPENATPTPVREYLTGVVVLLLGLGLIKVLASRVGTSARH